MAASWAPPTLCPKCGFLTSRYTCANSSGDLSDDDNDDEDDDHDHDDHDHDDTEYYLVLGKMGLVLGSMYAFWIFESGELKINILENLLLIHLRAFMIHYKFSDGNVWKRSLSQPPFS